MSEDLAPRWSEALRTIAALFVISRVLLILVAAVVEQDLPLTVHGAGYSDAPILRSLTGSDSLYLLRIARDGYHLLPNQLGFLDWAFFPLYPLVTRVVSAVTLGDIALAGVVVSNVAFIGALFVLYRLTVEHLGHDDALRALAFITFAPGAVAFGMAYSDSLFLLLAATAFLAAEQRRWWLMGLCLALASITRLQGLVLAIPLAVLLIQCAGTWRTPRLAWLLAAPAAFAAFGAYLGAMVGDPLGMLHAQNAWSEIGTGTPSSPGPAGIPVVDRTDPLVLILIGVLLAYVFLLVYFKPDRIGLAYTLFAVTALAAAPLALRIQSIPRYLAIAWPFDWVLAKRRASWLRAVGLAASGALFAAFAVLDFTRLAP